MIKLKIDKIKIPIIHYTVSLDVVSMFDNISLNLALKCVDHKLNTHRNVLMILIDELIIAVQLTTIQCPFR